MHVGGLPGSTLRVIGVVAVLTAWECDLLRPSPWIIGVLKRSRLRAPLNRREAPVRVKAVGRARTTRHGIARPAIRRRVCECQRAPWTLRFRDDPIACVIGEGVRLGRGHVTITNLH